MTKSVVESIWSTYFKAYSAVSSAERDDLLRQCVSDDVVSTNPNDEMSGIDNLIAHVEQFQQRMPGAYFTSNELMLHHDQALVRWTLHKSDGSPVRTAHTYARFNEKGQLSQLTGFF